MSLVRVLYESLLTKKIVKLVLFIYLLIFGQCQNHTSGLFLAIERSNRTF